MDHNIAAAFGQTLRKARLDAGLSQEQLALASDIDRTFISMLERGIRQPTLTTVFAIADTLQVKPEVLVARTAKLRKS